MISKFLGALILCCVSYPFWRSSMQKQSLEDIPVMQENTSLEPFFHVINWAGKDLMVQNYLVVAFNLMPKTKALYLWSTIAAVQYFSGLLEMVYNQPRPCHALKQACELSQGSPEIKSIRLIYLAATLYLQKYYEVGKPPQRFQSVMCTGYIVKMAGTALTGFFFILFGFSKLYYAKASYDQVLFTYMLGLIFALGFHFCLKIHFIKLPEYLKTENDRYDVTPYHLFIVVLNTFVSPFLLALVLFQFSKSNQSYVHTHQFMAVFGCILGNLTEMKFQYTNVRN